MDITGLIPHIEALIFASDKPLTPLELTDLLNNAFGFMEDKITLDQVEAAVSGVVEKYQSEFYPFEVRESGGGWQFLTKKDYHKTVAQINGDKFMKRLSPAALETLSIIAYKQPVTKGEVEAIRGVSADYAIQKLLEKELVIISGRNEKLPGHPLVYSTSKNFMDYFGINSAEELPKIKEVLAEQEIVPTPVNEEGDAPLPAVIAPEELPLAVAENGELIEAANKTEASETENEAPDAPAQATEELSDATADEAPAAAMEEHEAPGATGEDAPEDGEENKNGQKPDEV
ncbi:SMC-Scp complex subunit ScpB [Niabella soli]|uniref:Chromosome segregation and condensation protein ScpB n=1 Tax=Niabella soli DSM 19437 TaxID=929713 RepID=W0EXC7_9BACT|nr:SMC-Scp complex subunit ScpB [Niabella soli]AHF15480.1 chromosome segregation and condensation protein ScpB [Niabella soli DSM 19437]